jgi:hypothetical protein
VGLSMRVGWEGVSIEGIERRLGVGRGRCL